MNGSRGLMLADVLDAIARQDLSPTVKRDMASAIRKIGVLLGRNLQEIPADPARLNARFQLIVPSVHGISQQRWANVRSLTLKAIGLVRPVMPGRRLNTMSSAWQVLLDRVEGQSARFRLGPLCRFLSEEGIEPEAVTTDDLLGYRDRLLNESIRSKPELTWDSLLWQWNKAVREIEGFPQVIIERAQRRERKTLDETEFLPSLLADRDAWLDRLQGESLLDEGPVHAVSSSTRKTRAYQIHYFASASVRAGIDVGSLKSLADLVSDKNFEKVMRYIFDDQSRKKSSHLAGIGGAMIAIARHWVLPKSGLSDIECQTILSRMRFVVSRVSPEQEGLTEKNHERLMQFESDEAIGRFLNLPDTLRAEIDTNKLPISQKHAVADVVLALEIMLVAPVRMKNLIGIRIDKHLMRYRDGYMLVFEKAEVKNKTRLQFKLPQPTCEVIDWYLKSIRSERVKGDTDALFLGEDGIQSKAQSSLSNQLSKKVYEKTGLKFNAHLIRHVTSFLYLKEVPGGHHVLRLVLGHKSVDMLQRAYTGAETKSAHSHFDGVIRVLRDRHVQPVKRGRPPKSASLDEVRMRQTGLLPDYGRLKKRGD
jgi:integrase